MHMISSTGHTLNPAAVLGFHSIPALHLSRTCVCGQMWCRYMPARWTHRQHWGRREWGCANKRTQAELDICLTKRQQVRKLEGSFNYLTVEDIFRGGLLIFHVPYQGHAVGLMRSILVVVVWGDQEFRILRAEDRRTHNLKWMNECVCVCGWACVCSPLYKPSPTSAEVLNLL